MVIDLRKNVYLGLPEVTDAREGLAGLKGQ